MYTLRSKVTVEDRSAAMDVAVVFGSGADKILPVAGATAFVDPRLPELGVRVLAPAGQTAALLALPEAPPADYEALRLRLGVPDGSRDLRSRRRCCWRAASTSCTASTGRRAATWARS